MGVEGSLVMPIHVANAFPFWLKNPISENFSQTNLKKKWHLHKAIHCNIISKDQIQLKCPPIRCWLNKLVYPQDGLLYSYFKRGENTAYICGMTSKKFNEKRQSIRESSDKNFHFYFYCNCIDKHCKAKKETNRSDYF